ncbi:MAG: DUF5312 domain-containing protein, partial [Spirochaetaceae bacterium]|nr:DUF5312 domain-containing protein [Spirochaetaceae bacterium]
PVAFSGGEEWFSTYKNYWIEQTNKNFAQWIQERRLTQLMQTFISFFSGAPLLPIEHAWSNENEDGIPVEGALNLSFLLTFHKLIFMPDINTVIRPILVDGEFYKKENKTEFLEAYNIIIKLDDIIKDFNKNLATGGEYGKLWMQIEGDMLALSVKRRKIQALMDEVNTTSGRISTDAKSALVSMQNVLTGIVNRGTNPKYDTLSNFAKLAGKGTTYTDAINKSINTINKAVNIIEDINETERMEGID